LTNLLARHAQTRFDTLEHINIHALLGLEEAHGAAAAQWTLQNLNASYTVHENGEPHRVGSFTEHKQAIFPAGLGQRRVYCFNLADQHVVTRTLNLPSVSTWVTFDPALMARVMAFMRWSGLSKLLRDSWIINAIVKMSTTKVLNKMRQLHDLPGVS
jgi:saccharopine dehydrogenase-like NADP-dependent oxidoreductase